MASDDTKDYKFVVKPLQRVADFPQLRRNARAYLTRRDPLLLGVERESMNYTPEAILE